MCLALVILNPMLNVPLEISLHITQLRSSTNQCQSHISVNKVIRNSILFDYLETSVNCQKSVKFQYREEDRSLKETQPL